MILENCWLKIFLEYIFEGLFYLGVVVMNNGYFDWLM